MKTLVASPFLSKPDIRTQERCVARELTANDTKAYKKVRLRALKEEGPLFGPLYETESLMTDREWQARCSKTKDHCFFGLFDKNKLVGILFASGWKEDKSGKTALWGSAYVVPEYRGHGHAAPLYKAREEWTKKHPHYKRAVFFILEGNKRSAELHEKNGAKHVKTETMNWAGRPPALWRWYKKPLRKNTPPDPVNAMAVGF